MTAKSQVPSGSSGLNSKKRDFKQMDTIFNHQESESELSDDDIGSRYLKRQNKNQPMEISSKRPVSRKRRVIESDSSSKSRDPRFDPLCGNYKKNEFDQRYGFLDQYKKSEIQMLKTSLKKEKNVEEKERLNKLLNSMQSQLGEKKRKEKEQEVKRSWRKKEEERVKHGKKPFYLKKSEMRKMELIQKYEDIKAQDGNSSAKLDKLIEKRRLKHAQKHHKSIPRSRR